MVLYRYYLRAKSGARESSLEEVLKRRDCPFILDVVPLRCPRNHTPPRIYRLKTPRRINSRTIENLAHHEYQVDSQFCYPIR